MKKLMVLLLVLVLTFSCIFTASVFAGKPPEEADKGLERAIDWDSISNDQSYQSLMQGLIASYYYGSVPSHVTWHDSYWGYIVIKSLLSSS